MSPDAEILTLLREQNRLLRKLVHGQRTSSRALLSSASAAKVLGRRHADVLAWIAEGRLRTVDVDGRSRVPRS
jgi:phage regulator Rha-like protein